MKKTFLFILGSTFFVFSFCFGQVTFQKTFNFNNGLFSYGVRQTSDWGYIIVGNAYAVALAPHLIKTDYMGDTVWMRNYFTQDYCEDVYAVCENTDGGYLLTGSRAKCVNDSIDIYLIKTDSNGDTLWTRAYNNKRKDEGAYSQETHDGGFIVVGSSRNLVYSSSQVYLLKINNAGDTTWTETFGGAGGCRGYSVKATNDNGYIVAGSIYDTLNNDNDVLVIKTDSAGDTLWVRAYAFGGIGNEEGASVIQASDGGYIIAGSSTNTGYGLIFKIDVSGNLLWSKSFTDQGSSSLANCVESTADGGCIVAGSIHGSWSQKAAILKMASNGDTMWTKLYGDYDSVATSVQQTYDGGYIIAGNQYNGSTHWLFSFLIKTDSYGNSGCYDSNEPITVTNLAAQVYSPIITVSPTNTVISYTPLIVGSGGSVTIDCFFDAVKTPIHLSEILISPNPTTSLLNIQTTQSIDHIELFNLLGKQVGSWHPEMFGANGNEEITIDLTQLSPGIYILQAGDGEKVWRGKVVKE